MKVFVFIFLGLDLPNSYINTNLVVLFFWVGSIRIQILGLTREIFEPRSVFIELIVIKTEN